MKDLGYFKNYSHLDIVKVFNGMEWNYILVIDYETKNGEKKRRLFNLSYQGDEVKPKWYDKMNVNCFEFYKNLGDEATKSENDIR